MQRPCFSTLDVPCEILWVNDTSGQETINKKVGLFCVILECILYQDR